MLRDYWLTTRKLAGPYCRTDLSICPSICPSVCLSVRNSLSLWSSL